MHCVLFRIPPGTTREAMIEKLKTDKRILIVQPLNEFESAADHRAGTTPTGGFDDPYARLQSNVLALDVAEAHNFSRGAGIRVAIIDTGVDTRHPDLAGRTQLTRNYIDADEVAFRGDRHGTQVAGLIAASANNGIGIVGVAPDVRLLAYKACWQVSANTSGRCNSFTIAQALADALAAKAQVINLSLVGPSDPLLEALIAKATSAGVIVVGAASDRSAIRLSRQTTARAAGRRGGNLFGRGRRHPARAGARHRHAGARTATTTSRPAVRWPPRRFPEWWRCCWRATRNSASRACANC